MSDVFFYLSLLTILMIFAIFVFSITSKKYHFFPPPSKSTWQYFVFWTLFRAFIFGLGVVSYQNFTAPESFLQLFVALSMAIIGIGLAAYLSYAKLGSKNSYGLKDGLVTSGLFKYSRNPIYVATIFGMLGWGLLANAVQVWVLLVLWALLYLLAPFFEEPWLKLEYKEQYLEYKKSVPRFIGFKKSKKN